MKLSTMWRRSDDSIGT